MIPTPSDAIALVALLEPKLARVLVRAGYQVSSATSGLVALELAKATMPDLIVLDSILEDMSGADACRLLRSEPGIARNLPILIVCDGLPSPELRVAALRVGVTDFLEASASDEEILLKVAVQVEAKRSPSDTSTDPVIDLASGFCSLPALSRRARELASLMTRVHGPFACVVVEIEGRATIRDLGGVVARAARLSDVVGDLGPRRMGILAPGTSPAGAVRLAVRVGDAIRAAAAARPSTDRAIPLICAAGFDVVSNAKYAPIDPFALLQRAATAVRQGQADPVHPWIRRYGEPLIERRTPPGITGAQTLSRISAEGVIE